jgi:hypothetical protein
MIFCAKQHITNGLSHEPVVIDSSIIVGLWLQSAVISCTLIIADWSHEPTVIIHLFGWNHEPIQQLYSVTDDMDVIGSTSIPLAPLKEGWGTGAGGPPSCMDRGEPLPVAATALHLYHGLNHCCCSQAHKAIRTRGTLNLFSIHPIPNSSALIHPLYHPLFTVGAHLSLYLNISMWDLVLKNLSKRI